MSIMNSDLFSSIVGSRIEEGLHNLRVNQGYAEYCLQQEQKEREFEEMLGQLGDDDRKAIQRQHERHVAKVSYQLDEVYYQGLRDSVKLLAFLGLFEMTERL